MAQALDEGEAGELRGLTTLVEQRQVGQVGERAEVAVWAKMSHVCQSVRRFYTRCCPSGSA
jgi:hypothetical protein